MELELLTGASLSYCNGQELLNRLLRREAESRLRKHGFKPESGKPRSEEKLPPELRKEAKAEDKPETIAKAIEKINAGRQAEEERVKASQTETEDPENAVYVSADDAGVRHQEEHRTAENQKNGAFIWSTNALVQSREGERIFTCVGMKKAFLFVLSYLLDKGMLRNRSLVFFVDGAGNLLSNIAEMFAFYPYRVILDWYHLKKRCQEYLSVSFKSKEGKKRTLQKLLRILWAGNVTEAILYLQNLKLSPRKPSRHGFDGVS